MKNGPEAAAKKLIADEEVIYYHAHVSYYSGKILEDFPSAVTVEYGAMRYESGKWAKGDRLGGLLLRPAKPSLDGKALNINTLGRDALYKMGLPYGLAASIAAEAPYIDLADLRAKMNAHYSSLSRPVNFNKEYWPTVKSFVAENDLTF